MCSIRHILVEPIHGSFNPGSVKLFVYFCLSDCVSVSGQETVKRKYFYKNIWCVKYIFLFSQVLYCDECSDGRGTLGSKLGRQKESTSYLHHTSYLPVSEHYSQACDLLSTVLLQPFVLYWMSLNFKKWYLGALPSNSNSTWYSHTTLLKVKANLMPF